MAVMTFKKAEKTNIRLRMAIVGPTGCGKTWTSLTFARALAGPQGKVALIDTERKSASKYADQHDFDVLELESFEPKMFIDAIKAAGDAGYDVLNIDSLSHAWMGEGGILSQVDKVQARTQNKGNSFTAWRDVTPMHNALVEAILQAPMHVIVTMRAKMEYAVEKDEQKGKTSVRKIGLAPVQRDGLEYEFDVVCEMTVENDLIVGKTRCPSISGDVVRQPGAEWFAKVTAWLNSGKSAPAAAPPSTECPPELRTRMLKELKAWSGVEGPDLVAALKSVLRAVGIPFPPEGQKLSRAEVERTLEFINDHQKRECEFAEAMARHSATGNTQVPGTPASAPDSAPDEAKPCADGGASGSAAAPKAESAPFDAGSSERASWPAHKRPGPGHVCYWRDQMKADFKAWATLNPKQSHNCDPEEVLLAIEEALGLPRPGQMDEAKAAAIYKEAAAKEHKWRDFCQPF